MGNLLVAYCLVYETVCRKEDTACEKQGHNSELLIVNEREQRKMKPLFEFAL